MATASPTAQGADPGRPVTARPLVVLGGGNHARVVIEAARSHPGDWDVVGIVDPEPAATAVALLGVDHLGGDDAFADRLARSGDGERPWLVVGVGGIDPEPRRRLAERFGRLASWATVVHAAAWISPTAELGNGTVALAGSIVNGGARIGGHVVLNSGAIVEHDVTIGEFAHLAPGAVVGGGTEVGAGVFIGLGARVRDHVAIGDRAVVGMGAVVIADVPAGACVVGVPARVQEGRGG
jgi:sugar O-acyltransferase (sialic acid O-acetyltransferase NeuD family)